MSHPPQGDDQPGDGSGAPPVLPHRPSPFPASGPPPDAPPAEQPRRSRVGLVAAALALLLIAGGTAVFLTLRPLVLDPAAVERDVARQWEERETAAVELSCPDDMPVTSGDVYHCSGTTSDGEEVTIEIQIADSLDGAYSWVEV